jgi:hypothetical protein
METINILLPYIITGFSFLIGLIFGMKSGTNKAMNKGFEFGVTEGREAIKEEINDMTVRELLAHKRKELVDL